MKILVDENLPRRLVDHLSGHESRTVAECGWAGKKNGELLAMAETEFDVLLTLDKNLPFQQDLRSGRLAILIVRAVSNRVQDILPIVPECLAALERIRPGQVVRVGKPPNR
jgi:predicted nuclease of predicted toxin-antitoxin system